MGFLIILRHINTALPYFMATLMGILMIKIEYLTTKRYGRIMLKGYDEAKMGIFTIRIRFFLTMRYIKYKKEILHYDVTIIRRDHELHPNGGKVWRDHKNVL